MEISESTLLKLIEIAKLRGDDQVISALAKALKKYQWDESFWRQQRVEAIVELSIYCDRHPKDQEAKKYLQSEFRAWEDRYGELDFKSLSQWQKHWEPILGAIEVYEDEKLFKEEDADEEGVDI